MRWTELFEAVFEVFDVLGDKHPHTVEGLADIEAARKGWEARHSNWQNW